jgi:hypothetical protein
MKITPLPNSRHFTHKVELTFADLTTAGLTQATNLIALLSGMLIERVGFRLRTNFSGGGATSLTLQLGDAGSANRFLAAQSIWGASSPIAAAGGQTFFAYTAAENFRVTFTSVTANLNTITAGKVDVYVKLVDLNENDAV